MRPFYRNLAGFAVVAMLAIAVFSNSARASPLQQDIALLVYDLVPEAQMLAMPDPLQLLGAHTFVAMRGLQALPLATPLHALELATVPAAPVLAPRARWPARFAT